MHPSLHHSRRRHSFRRAATVAALVVTAALSLSLNSSALNAQSINLTDNESPTAPFGKAIFPTFGQTFAAPAGGNFLQSFSFWLLDDPAALGTSNASSLLFQAYVMQWDAANGHAIGPVLYASGVQSGPTQASQRYDFAATNVAVSGSAQYVAFLSASAWLSSIPTADALVGIESSLNGTYTGGQFVFADNGSDFAALSTDPWFFTGFPEYQTHFSANFSGTAVSVVPEPSSLLLLVAGLSALLVVAGRCKRV